MKKIKRFLLVDDSDATNFFNRVMIEKTGYVEEVLIVKNGKEALDCIQSGKIPEVIFLDINMPVMDGWEFLSEYQALDIKFKTSIIVLMVSTPLINGDKKRADSISEIVKCSPKHLTKEIIIEIIGEHLHKEYNFG